MFGKDKLLRIFPGIFWEKKKLTVIWGKQPVLLAMTPTNKLVSTQFKQPGTRRHEPLLFNYRGKKRLGTTDLPPGANSLMPYLKKRTS